MESVFRSSKMPKNSKNKAKITTSTPHSEAIESEKINEEPFKDTTTIQNDTNNEPSIESVNREPTNAQNDPVRSKSSFVCFVSRFLLFDYFQSLELLQFLAEHGAP